MLLPHLLSRRFKNNILLYPLFPLVRAAVGEVKAQFEAVFRIVCRSKVVPFFRGARQGRAFQTEESERCQFLLWKGRIGLSGIKNFLC